MHNRSKFLLLILSAMLTTLSCKSGNKGQEAQVDNGQSVPADTLLRLPEVPLSMTDNADRAAYVVDHFWDNLDLNDTARSLNRNFMEQNFANYLSVFPLVEPDRLATCVDDMLNHTKAVPAVHNLMAELANKYLYEPNSPMANEGYYRLFLESLIGDPDTDSALRERYEFELSCIKKNQPGALAANFNYVDRDGATASLLTTRFSSDYLLLLFYDPECDNCKSIIAHMLGDLHINSFIDSGRLTILAVDAEGDRELWNSTRMEMPQQWRVAYDVSSIRDRNTYVLRALPSLYLLDKSLHIVMKDAPADAVAARLQQE